MKFIPAATVVLWISIITGVLFAPNIIFLPFVKFPLFVLLSIFIPISFWLVQAKKHKLLSLVYVGIFVFDVAVLLMGASANISVFKAADEHNEERIDPKLAGLLTAGESREIRETTSRIIYEKHGVALPYKNEEGTCGTFQPSLADEATYESNMISNHRNAFAKHNALYQLGSFVLLIALHVIIFTGLLVYLILFDTDRQRI